MPQGFAMLEATTVSTNTFNEDNNTVTQNISILQTISVTMTVVGYISNSNMPPQSGVTVTLYYKGEQVGESKTTDENGQVTFNDLVKGQKYNYVLSGFSSDWVSLEDTVDCSSSQRTIYLDLPN